jgi:hypothetical protein
MESIERMGLVGLVVLILLFYQVLSPFISSLISSFVNALAPGFLNSLGL